MAQRTQLDDASNPLHEAYACLLANGLDGAGEALRILVNEASRIERAQHLQATPYERSAQRVDYANGYKPECVNDFATPGVINLLCSVVYLFAPPVLVD